MSDSVDALTGSVDRLDAKVGGLDVKVGQLDSSLVAQQTETRKRTLVIGAFLAGIIIVLLATVPAMVKVSLDNRAAIAENNRKFCPFISILIPQPGQAQPTTERGRQVAVAAAQKWREFGCDQLQH